MGGLPRAPWREGVNRWCSSLDDVRRRSPLIVDRRPPYPSYYPWMREPEGRKSFILLCRGRDSNPHGPCAREEVRVTTRPRLVAIDHNRAYPSLIRPIAYPQKTRSNPSRSIEQPK